MDASKRVANLGTMRRGDAPAGRLLHGRSPERVAQIMAQLPPLQRALCVPAVADLAQIAQVYDGS